MRKKRTLTARDTERRQALVKQKKDAGICIYGACGQPAVTANHCEKHAKFYSDCNVRRYNRMKAALEKIKAQES